MIKGIDNEEHVYFESVPFIRSVLYERVENKTYYRNAQKLKFISLFLSFRPSRLSLTDLPPAYPTYERRFIGFYVFDFVSIDVVDACAKLGCSRNSEKLRADPRHQGVSRVVDFTHCTKRTVTNDHVLVPPSGCKPISCVMSCTCTHTEAMSRRALSAISLISCSKRLGVRRLFALNIAY